MSQESRLSPLARNWWTADEVLALPDDGVRYEAVEGALIVNPPPSWSHQVASFDLHVLLSRAAREAGAPVWIGEGIGVNIPREQMLIPDLAVVRTDFVAKPGNTVDPADVLLVVEVVSPGSTLRDRLVKPVLYAEARIPHFWRIELGNFRGRTEKPPVVFAHDLDGDEYTLTHRVGAGEAFTIDEPFPITIDPIDLIESNPAL